jgi:hypothetical protein
LQPFLVVPSTSTLESWFFVSSLIALGFDLWCSNSCRSSLVSVVFRFRWSTFWGSFLATLKCLPFSCWSSKTTCVFYLQFSTLFMLPNLCWFSPYAFKMLMKNLRLYLSQLGSSNMLKEFCLWIWKNELCIQVCTIALWIWACYFWREWDV